MAIVGLRKGSMIREREVLVLDTTKQTVYAHLERNADSLTSAHSVEVITRRHSVIATVERRNQHSYELNANYEMDSRNYSYNVEPCSC